MRSDNDRPIEGLSDEVSRFLLEAARPRPIHKGRVLYPFDDYPSTVTYVQRGWFKLATFTPEGDERVLAVKKRGDFLGLEAVADPDFQTPEITALTDGIVLQWDVNELRARFSETPAFTMAVGRVLARTAQRDLTQRVVADSGRVAARLARIIYQLAREQGQEVSGGLKLQLPLTQEELAELITVRRETVSLNFGELEREGVIRRDGRTVIIQVEPMEEYLESHGMGLEDNRRRRG
ncbi:MAG TPA: Crp/Fnr family transcriptional regulator [Deinococcales bacterium]|nr:Crp/Fnr family transcriptional regulator [Deinococcales bacterium]